MNNINNKLDTWDKFIGHMMLCISSAESKYKYFVIDEIDSKDISDLFFFRLAYIANTFVKSCHIYCFSRRFFGFIKFKLKEKRARSVPMHVINMMPSKEVHICSKSERLELLEDVLGRYGLKLDDIKDIYEEYYTK